jgi:hypothetical protein
MRGCALANQGFAGVVGEAAGGEVCTSHCLAMFMVIWSRKSPDIRAVSLSCWMKRTMPSWSIAMRMGKSAAANWVRVLGATTSVGVPCCCSTGVLGVKGLVGDAGVGNSMEHRQTVVEDGLRVIRVQRSVDLKGIGLG